MIQLLFVCLFVCLFVYLVGSCHILFANEHVKQWIWKQLNDEMADYQKSLSSWSPLQIDIAMKFNMNTWTPQREQTRKTCIHTHTHTQVNIHTYTHRLHTRCCCHIRPHSIILESCKPGFRLAWACRKHVASMSKACWKPAANLLKT